MPMIEVIEVSKFYKKVCALQNVSLNVHQGDIYGIIGLSGAGKSTLIRCLAGLVSPCRGKVVFRGQDIAQMDRSQLRSFRKEIGMVFQHFNLLSSRTVAANIAYPMEIAGIAPEIIAQRVDELLRLVNLTGKKNAYPSQLSGGEKQRVGIARALANHPKALFCDEATSALDPRTTKEILDLLKTINKKLGVTIVLITHDMEVIKRICTKVAVIEGGQLVENGVVAEVFAKPQHPITQHFIESSSHEIPPEFYMPLSPNRKLLRLRFNGKAAGEPLIAQVINQYQVEANILLGWIDKLQTTTIGILIVELTGNPEGIAHALKFLTANNVNYEVLEHAP